MTDPANDGRPEAAARPGAPAGRGTPAKPPAPIPMPTPIPKPVPIPRPAAPGAAPAATPAPAGPRPFPMGPRPPAPRVAGPMTPSPFPAMRGPAPQQPFAPTGGSSPGERGVDAVREALRNKVERVPLSALERRGFRNVQVLDMAAIEKIVAEAVTHLLERHTAVMTDEEREKVEAEARQEFSKLLAEHKKLSVEKTEVERKTEELERQMQGLREELTRQNAQLASEQASIDEHSFTLSPAAFSEMEEKIRKLFGKLISDERRATLAEAGPGALKGLSQLEREVASMLDRLLVGERERFMGSLKRESNEKIGLLEKRIQKLNKALADSEEALRAMAAAKAVDPGIASIYDKVQGLNPDDPFYTRKKELLAEILEQNQKLLRPKKNRAQTQAEEREKAHAAEAAAKGSAEAAIEAAHQAQGSGRVPAQPAAPPARPAEKKFDWALPSAGGLDFEPPVETVSDETAF